MKKLLFLFVFVSVASLMSSCSTGYGCYTLEDDEVKENRMQEKKNKSSETCEIS